MLYRRFGNCGQLHEFQKISENHPNNTQNLVVLVQLPQSSCVVRLRGLVEGKNKPSLEVEFG